MHARAKGASPELDSKWAWKGRRRRLISETPGRRQAPTLGVMGWVETLVGAMAPLIATGLMAIPIAIWHVIRRIDKLDTRITQLEGELAGLREDYRRTRPYGDRRRTRQDDP